MNEKRKTRKFWTLLLVIFFGYLLYQWAFSWSEEVNEPEVNGEVSEEETIFLTIENKHYFVQNTSMGSIREALEMWSFDKKTNRVSLKHASLKPTDKTQMMVIYDGGYDSFERQSSVLSLINFPYKHYIEEEKLFEITSISENGEVFMSYDNKKIHLKPGESYWTFSTEGFKLTKITIKNYGLFNKDQFGLMGEKIEEGSSGDETDGKGSSGSESEEEKRLKYKSQPLIELEE